MKKTALALLFVFIIQNSPSQWVSQNVPGSVFFLNGIDFFNAQTGAVGGWYVTLSPKGFSSGGFSTFGRALFTSNGGTNWINVSIPDSLRILIAIQYIDQQNVYGFGVKNITPSKTENKFPEDPANSRYTVSTNSHRLRVLNQNYSKGMQAGQGDTRGYFLKSTNSGQSWHYYSAMPVGVTYLYEGAFINSSTGFASAVTVGNSYNKSGIVRTTNGGLNWNFVSPPDSFQNYNRMEFPNSTTGFAVGEHFDSNFPNGFMGLILRTTNGGSNWSRTNISDINNFQGVSFSNSTTGIACGTSNDPIPGAHFYKTTNAGASWFLLPFQVDSALAGGISLVNGTGRGFAFGSKLQEDPENPGLLKVSGYYINRTTDYGISWHKSFYPDTESILINSTDIDQNTWYISGGNFFKEKGVVLKTTNGGGPIGISPISVEIPGMFNVYQNYPNPFNPVTKIRFDVPKSGNISFKVYDVLGEIIYSLSGNKTAGTYEITFDGKDIASGIYYYSVETNGSRDVKKMVLLK